MSRDYGRVRTTFWSDDKVNPWPVERKLMALYLLTSPHSTALGAFYLHVAYAGADIGVTREDVVRLLRELDTDGWLVWCPKSQWVWIVNYLGHNAPENNNVRKHIVGLFGQVPQTASFRERLGAVVEALPVIPPPRFRKGGETVTEPLATSDGETAQGGETVTPPDAGGHVQGGETVHPPSAKGGERVAPPEAENRARSESPTEPNPTEPNRTDPLASLASGAREVGEPLGNGSETVGPPDSKADDEIPEFLRRTQAYPETFEAFARAFPHPSLGWPKMATYEAWERATTLTTPDKLVMAAEAYAVDLKKRNAKFPKEAKNWLAEERFAGFLVDIEAADAAAIAARTMAPLWDGKGDFLLAKHTPATIATWLGGSTLQISEDGTAAILTVDGDYKRTYVFQHFAPEIERELGLSSLAIVVAPAVRTEQRAAAAA